MRQLSISEVDVGQLELLAAGHVAKATHGTCFSFPVSFLGFSGLFD